MCGRYVLSIDLNAVQQEFNAPMTIDFAPRYNIAPTQSLPVVLQPKDEERRIELLRWGLIPSWSKDMSIGSKLINARAETVAEKPSFRSAFTRRRCIVPATGYYEWLEREGEKTRQPMFIHLTDRSVFGMAGLWETWRDPESGEDLRTYTIITTDANEFMSKLHHRMPVILHQDDYQTWLEPEAPPVVLQSLLTPYTDSKAMDAHEVARTVNRVTFDAPELIQPLSA